MKKCFVLLMLTAALYACKNAGGKNNSSPFNTVLPDDVKANQSNSQWQYEGNVNNVSIHAPYLATIDADAKLDFDSLHHDGCTVSLTLRTTTLRTDAMLSILKGKFKPGVASINIRFDDKTPIKFTCSKSTNGDAGLIFIENAPALINELKKSKTAVIQVQPHQAGPMAIKFTTAGLIWPHLN